MILIVILFIVNQRERERRNSDRSEDGYHSDGDYGEHDYRHDISDERESKTIMLRGLPITITESDVRGNSSSDEQSRRLSELRASSIIFSCYCFISS